METTGVEPVVPFGRRIYSPLGLPIFLHLHNLVLRTGFEPVFPTWKASVLNRVDERSKILIQLHTHRNWTCQPERYPAVNPLHQRGLRFCVYVYKNFLYSKFLKNIVNCLTCMYCNTILHQRQQLFCCIITTRLNRILFAFHSQKWNFWFAVSILNWCPMTESNCRNLITKQV